MHPGAGGLEPGAEAERADALQQGDGGEVEGSAEGDSGGDGAVVPAGEVFRGIAAEMLREVDQQRLRAGQAGLEGERVQERFERRAGRADGAGEVHGAGAAGTAVSRDEGGDLAGGDVGDQHGHRETVGLMLEIGGDHAFEAGLEREIERRADGVAAEGGDGGAGVVREGGATGRDRGVGVGEDAVAEGAGGGGVAVRAEGFRAAWEGDEESGLGGVEEGGGGAEPGAGAGLDAFEVAAKGGQAEPDAEDAGFAVVPFELEGAGGFDEFAAQRAGAGLEQAGGLHRQRGAAGDDMAGAEHLDGCAGQGERVDAGMGPEAAVFGVDQEVEVVAGDLVGGGAEAPDAARGGEHGQDGAVAVEDGGAVGGEPGEVGG